MEEVLKLYTSNVWNFFLFIDGVIPMEGERECCGAYLSVEGLLCVVRGVLLFLRQLTRNRGETQKSRKETVTKFEKSRAEGCSCVFSPWYKHVIRTRKNNYLSCLFCKTRKLLFIFVIWFRVCFGLAMFCVSTYFSGPC